MIRAPLNFLPHFPGSVPVPQLQQQQLHQPAVATDANNQQQQQQQSSTSVLMDERLEMTPEQRIEKEKRDTERVEQDMRELEAWARVRR